MTIDSDEDSASVFEIDFDEPKRFQPVEMSENEAGELESGLDDSGYILDANTEGRLSMMEDSNLKQRLGELYIRLGQAIHEADSVRARALEIEIAEVREKLTPSFEIPEIPYPSPLAEESYHGLAGETLRAIGPHSEADPVALLTNLLTAYGSAIGGGSWFTVGVDRHMCNLFCVSVGDTGKGRKGTSWGPVRELLTAVEIEWAQHSIQSGLSSGEGLVWHVRDEIYKSVPDKKTGICELIDGGVQDKRLLIIEGELAQTLKVLSRESNILSPVLRNAWDGGKLQTLTKNSPVTATGAHVSVISHITRQELMRGLGEVETSNGFANRFLWFCVKRSKALPFGGDFNSVDMDTLTDKLRKAVDFGKSAGAIKFAEKTKPLWASIYPALSEGKPGIVGAITARAEAQVVRLACIYALLDCSTEIEPEHLEAALAVWSYAEASVKYIFQNTAVDPLANKILEALAAKPQGMTRTEINDLLGGNHKTPRIMEALNALKDSGRAASKSTATGQGRPVERWILVTRVTEKTE